MIKSVNIFWSKTKKNVENIISRYIYYCLSLDGTPTINLEDDYLLEELDYHSQNNMYIKIETNEKKKRVDFINYFRFSFNKLTTIERKIIYWTYLDKENNYDDRFIANNLGFSLGYYYIKKKETLIRFAYCLGVEEYND